MYKRKFALFANGWSSDFLTEFMESAREHLQTANADLYAFIAYPAATAFPDKIKGAYSIFSLPKLEVFDGFIVLCSSINQEDIITNILDECLKTGKPVISIGKKYKNTIYATLNNQSGMTALIEHLLDYHCVKHISYIGGYKTHPDSMIREATLRHSLNARNLALADDDITYTDWEDVNAIAFVSRKIEENSLPDAFVCANDGLAMATITTLESNGITVPGDVIVTGFDNLPQSQVFSPSVSTVVQPFRELARKCISILIESITGREQAGDIIIDCVFHPNESCGCKCPSNINKIRKDFCKSFYSDALTRNKNNRMIVAFELKVDDSENYNDLIKNFRETTMEYINKTSDMLYILLNRQYFSSDINTSFPNNNYEENMDIFFGFEDGQTPTATICNRTTLFPQMNEDGKCHIYSIIPLFDSSIPFGYMVFRDVKSSIKSFTLQNYAAHLMSALSKYRQEKCLSYINGDLLALAKKDPLTNVKNRAAFEDAVNTINLEANANPMLKFAVVMFDINNLKNINDELGHKAGDDYIKNSCNLICYIFPQSPVFRIGGDEFCAIIRGTEYENRYQLLNKGRENMESLARAEILPRVQKVSIAIGISEFIPGKDLNFQDVFDRADALMYQNKAEMKAKMNELPR